MVQHLQSWSSYMDVFTASVRGPQSVVRSQHSKVRKNGGCGPFGRWRSPVYLFRRCTAAGQDRPIIDRDEEQNFRGCRMFAWGRNGPLPTLRVELRKFETATRPHRTPEKVVIEYFRPDEAAKIAQSRVRPEKSQLFRASTAIWSKKADGKSRLKTRE